MPEQNNGIEASDKRQSTVDASAVDGGERRRRVTWLVGLLVGASALAALVFVVIHVGDIAGFAQQAANAKAGPLFLAALAQGAPYLLAALVWFLFLQRAGARIRYWFLVPFSFAKLFADQAIPTGGLSGAALFMFALARRGVPEKTAFRAFAFTTMAYFFAFLIAAIVSLTALSLAERAPPALSASIAAFAAIVLALAVLLGLLALYRPTLRASFIRRRRILRTTAEFIAAAVDDIRKMPGLFLRLTVILLAIRSMDGLTLMLIATSIGEPVPLGVGFVAVVIASIAATIGPAPMGLGTFEAGMTASLTVFGMSVEGALTTTLIYRGLTLWLPLLPGFVIIQREFLHRPAVTQEKTDHDQDAPPVKRLEGGATGKEAP